MDPLEKIAGEDSERRRNQDGGAKNTEANIFKLPIRFMLAHLGASRRFWPNLRLAAE